jgi:hypothetical protein
MSGQFRRAPRVDPANARPHARCLSFHYRGEMPFAGKQRQLLWDPVFAGRPIEPTLRRRHGQRCLIGRERDAGLLAMQAPDYAGDLEHLAGGTGTILHIGDLVGRQHQRLGSQDVLGKARQGKRGKKQN